MSNQIANIPPSIDEIFCIDLVPQVEQKHKADNDPELELNLLLNKKNRMAIGRPISVVVPKNMEEDEFQKLIDPQKEIDPLILEKYKSYTLYVASFACSFIPDPDCIFESAKFEIELVSESEQGQNSEISPMILSMHPNKVKTENEREYEEWEKLGAKFKLPTVSGYIDTGGSNKVRFIRKDFQIVAFGVGASSGGWLFSTTNNENIVGNYLGLKMIIGTFEKVSISCSFHVSATVILKNRFFIPLIAKKKERKLDYKFQIT